MWLTPCALVCFHGELVCDLNIIRKWMLVAHACNTSYSGGRDQEDRGSKPARANSLTDSVLGIPITKKDWWSVFEFNPPHPKKGV
jgi:hypothetical protein